MRTDLINQTEALVLSSILFNPTLIEDISIKLKPNDFYFLPHKDIYEAMLNLHSDDIPIDEDYIIKKSKKPINQSILIKILSATPVTDIYKYVKSIKEDSLKRQFQNLSLELKKNRDRKSTRLNSSHLKLSRMPSSA